MIERRHLTAGWAGPDWTDNLQEIRIAAGDRIKRYRLAAKAYYPDDGGPRAGERWPACDIFELVGYESW